MDSSTRPVTGNGEPLLPLGGQPVIDPFLSAVGEARLSDGEVVLMPDGRLEVRTRGRVIEGTVLPAERFAAPTTVRRSAEQAVVAEMARRGTRWLAASSRWTVPGRAGCRCQRARLTGGTSARRARGCTATTCTA